MNENKRTALQFLVSISLFSLSYGGLFFQGHLEAFFTANLRYRWASGRFEVSMRKQVGTHLFFDKGDRNHKRH